MRYAAGILLVGQWVYTRRRHRFGACFYLGLTWHLFWLYSVVSSWSWEPPWRYGLSALWLALDAAVSQCLGGRPQLRRRVSDVRCDLGYGYYAEYCGP